MKFECDSAKSAANKEKHGLDFEEAQALWDDIERIHAPASHIKEERFLVVGRIGQKHWTAVITYRGEIVRVISVRRARQEEVFQYEYNQND